MAVLPAPQPDAPPTGDAPVLACRGLRRSYGDLVAVQDLALEIAAGETYGLLGPNGAGKTTSISMIAGILPADAGTITVCGRELTVHATAAKAAIGYVPQEIAVYPDLTARENLRFFATLYRMPRRRARIRVDEVLETVGLRERGGDRVSTYSGGMKRRLNIALGLLHEPRLLILDEPTVGVDPQSRNAILTAIEALGTAGMAVLYTTHYMEEAQRLCRRVGIIDLGRLIAEGTPRELTALIGERDRVRVEVTGDVAAAARALERVPTVQRVTVGTDEIELLEDDARTALPTILATLAGSGVLVRSVTVQEPDLEAVFLHLTGKSLRD